MCTATMGHNEKMSVVDGCRWLVVAWLVVAWLVVAWLVVAWLVFAWLVA